MLDTVSSVFGFGGDNATGLRLSSEGRDEVDFSDCDDAFVNLNTLEDLVALELRLEDTLSPTPLVKQLSIGLGGQTTSSKSLLIP